MVASSLVAARRFDAVLRRTLTCSGRPYTAHCDHDIASGACRLGVGRRGHRGRVARAQGGRARLVRTRPHALAGRPDRGLQPARMARRASADAGRDRHAARLRPRPRSRRTSTMSCGAAWADRASFPSSSRRPRPREGAGPTGPVVHRARQQPSRSRRAHRRDRAARSDALLLRVEVGRHARDPIAPRLLPQLVAGPKQLAAVTDAGSALDSSRVTDGFRARLQRQPRHRRPLQRALPLRHAPGRDPRARPRRRSCAAPCRCSSSAATTADPAPGSPPRSVRACRPAATSSRSMCGGRSATGSSSSSRSRPASTTPGSCPWSVSRSRRRTATATDRLFVTYGTDDARARRSGRPSSISERPRSTAAAPTLGAEVVRWEVAIALDGRAAWASTRSTSPTSRPRSTRPRTVLERGRPRHPGHHAWPTRSQR